VSGRVCGRPGFAGELGELASMMNYGRYSLARGRGLAILAVFTPARPLLGVAEIAEELGS
jgi:hypothetical protein